MRTRFGSGWSTVFLLLALTLAVTPAFAQKVSIDYDTNYDMDTIKTFSWAKTSETSLENTEPLIHSRLVNGIEYYMTKGDLREVETDPDVYVTYHTNTQTDVTVNNTAFSYAFPMGWYGGGFGAYRGIGVGVSAASTVTSYEKGTLIVDVWDRKTKNLVWRGTAANITVTEEAKKMTKRLDKALDKMVKEWAKLKKKDAR